MPHVLGFFAALAHYSQPVPLVHGDLVQEAIDGSLWFRVIVAIGTIWLIFFSTYVMRRMVTRADIQTLMLELRREIETESNARFLARPSERDALITSREVYLIRDATVAQFDAIKETLRRLDVPHPHG